MKNKKQTRVVESYDFSTHQGFQVVLMLPLLYWKQPNSFVFACEPSSYQQHSTRCVC